MRSALTSVIVFRAVSEAQAVGLVMSALEFSDQELVCLRRVSC
jgi:hypothetical protein